MLKFDIHNYLLKPSTRCSRPWCHDLHAPVAPLRSQFIALSRHMTLTCTFDTALRLCQQCCMTWCSALQERSVSHRVSPDFLHSCSKLLCFFPHFPLQFLSPFQLFLSLHVLALQLFWPTLNLPHSSSLLPPVPNQVSPDLANSAEEVARNHLPPPLLSSSASLPFHSSTQSRIFFEICPWRDPLVPENVFAIQTHMSLASRFIECP